MFFVLLSAVSHSNTKFISKSDLKSNSNSVSTKVAKLTTTKCSDQSATHEESSKDCLNCHIGHCSYLNTNSVSVASFLSTPIFNHKVALIHLFNYQYGLFRPPIAASV